MKAWLYVFIGLILSCLMGLLIMMIPHQPELDHLLTARRHRLSIKQAQSVVLGQIGVKVNKQSIKIQYKKQSIFQSDKYNFLSLYKAKGVIKSNGDSFYKIKDYISEECHSQVISKIQLLNSSIVITGMFQNCNESDYYITMHENQNNNLNIQIQLLKNVYNRIQVHFLHQNNNIYYGLGQQFSYLSLGHNRPYSTFVREKGVGRTAQPQSLITQLLHGVAGSYYYTYIPTPIWISNQKIGYILNSDSYMSWINNRVRVWDKKAIFIIIKQQSLKKVVSQITVYNGYTQPVPKWVNEGAILGLQGGTQQVKNKYLAMKSSGSRISGVWLQDWVSKRLSLGYSRLWWVWQLDHQHYPQWNQLREQLLSQSVKILIYINPMVTNPQPKKTFVKNYYKEGRQGGYFVNKTNGFFQTAAFSDFKAHLIDFYSSEGISFFRRILNNALDQTKAEGMMVDFAESYPVENMTTTLEQSIQNHNHFPTRYHQVVSNLLNERYGFNHSFYTFSRAGYLKTPKFTGSIWAGDQNMDYGYHTGIKSCLTAILSSGLVGFSNTHCDIGGYTYLGVLGVDYSTRSQDLMIKWMQLSAFTSVFRTHQGNNPKNTLQVYSTEKLKKNFAFYSNLFYILSIYREQQSKISAEQKLALVRPLFLMHQNNIQLSEIQDQFYLGNHILVSPYLQLKNERTYYLPKGDWIDLWNGNEIKGCDCLRISSGQLPPVYISKQYKDTKLLLQQISILINSTEQQFKQSNPESQQMIL